MPRANHLSPLLCLLVAVAADTPSVNAEEVTPWHPVDQTVGDLDLRAASSRRVEQGIGVFGQTGSLYQRPNDGQGWYLNGQEVTQQYQLRQPGFTAWVDRPDYLVQDALGEFSLNSAPALDGEFIDLVPPNTVFDLSNAAQQVFIPYADENDPNSPRINTRIDGWADTNDDSGGIRFQPPVAHRLPPHLIARRAEQRAEESDESTETLDSVDAPAPGSNATTSNEDNADDPSRQDNETRSGQE